MSKEEERIKYFGSDVDSTLVKIIVVAVVFHFAVAGKNCQTYAFKKRGNNNCK